MTDLDYQTWSKADAAKCQEVAFRVAESLPAPWKFAQIETQVDAMNAPRHAAIFMWNETRFALIPGGEITLGYDRSQPFVSSAEQQEEWEWTREESDAPPLQEYLDEVLTPLRQVTLEPVLMEVEAYECEMSRRKIEATLTRDGFRLPSSDEWEHACAAGARTLFRWGNTCPLDCYPFDTVSEEAWDRHKPHYTAPNGFGLRIAMDPYNWEVVRERDVRRGGDGGGAICGGEGFFAGWLSLASAYIHHSDLMDGVHVRRVFDLPASL